MFSDGRESVHWEQMGWIRLNITGEIWRQSLNKSLKKKLYGPFLWIGFNCLKVGRMKGWVDLGATQWFWTWDPTKSRYVSKLVTVIGFFLTKLKLLQVLLLSILMNCQKILELFFNVLVGKKDQCSQHIETSQLISQLAS